MDSLLKIRNYSLILVGVAAVANLALLDYLFIDYQERLAQLNSQVAVRKSVVPALTEKPATAAPAAVPAQKTEEACPKTCLTAIDTAVKTVSVPKQTVVTAPAATAVTRGEYFIPLGTGSVSHTDYSNTNWKTIDAAQATFDIASYGTIKAAYFEATLRNGSVGEAHARLYDSTTPQIFFTSEVYASTSTATFISAPITISSPGSKTYKVQMYSTLSTGTLDQARIRIVTQ